MVHTTISGNSFNNILWLQWIAAMGAMVILFIGGLMIGWTSPYLAQLTADDSPLPITRDKASWVASLFNFSRFLGAIVGGISVQCFGSKQTLVFIGFPLIIGWICIIVANSVIWLYVARVLTELSMGMSFSSFPLYIGEISSPAIRGALVSLAMSGLSFGNLVGNILGSYMSSVPTGSIIFILLFLWIPQSPYFLVRRSNMEKAMKSMARYNPNINAKIEVESVRNFINATETLTFRDRLREFNIPRNRKSGFIILVLYFFMQISGLNSVVFCTEIILTHAMVDIISPPTLVIVASACGVVSGWSAIYLADRLERKVLIIGSSGVVGISLVALRVHFALLDNGFDPDTLQWLAIIAILVLTFAVCNGITTVPGMLISEFFAPNIKS